MEEAVAESADGAGRKEPSFTFRRIACRAVLQIRPESVADKLGRALVSAVPVAQLPLAIIFRPLFFLLSDTSAVIRVDPYGKPMEESPLKAAEQAPHGPSSTATQQRPLIVLQLR